MKASFPDWILEENEDYLIVNKPPFLSTLEDRAADENLLQLAKAYWPDAQAAHRLDKETSGVLVFAKNAEAYRHLSLQFQNRKVMKTYHAVVDGCHRFEELKVEKPILKKSGGVVKIDSSGSPALTFFNTLRVYRAHTLVECHPVTGRMHQIRIHLAWVGAPIAGDLQYGGQPVYLSRIKKEYHLKKGTTEQPVIARTALHASRIKFADLSGTELEVEAPYPKDMRALLRQLAGKQGK